MFLRLKLFTSLAILVIACSLTAAAQIAPEKKDEKPQPSPTPATLITTKDQNQNATAEQVAESTVFVFGPTGREAFGNIRKTTIERGKISTVKPDGAFEKVAYQRWIIRAPSTDKEKVRFDQELPTARYAMVYNGEKIFGIYNNESFSPQDEAVRKFETQLYHGLEALLRYKENESKLEMVKREKILGVDLFIINVVDKNDRRTKFYISAKSFKVMALEYIDNGVTYTRRFYNYNYSQGTLVPYRSVLMVGDKVVEEADIQTITFGQRVDEGMFSAG